MLLVLLVPMKLQVVESLLVYQKPLRAFWLHRPSVEVSRSHAEVFFADAPRCFGAFFPFLLRAFHKALELRWADCFLKFSWAYVGAEIVLSMRVGESASRRAIRSRAATV